MQEKKDDAKNKDDAKEEKDNKVVATDDEDEIKFCELWDYEQDELPSNIHELSLGTGKEKQMTMKQFCKKHN